MMIYLVSFIYWLIFAKIFLEIYRFISYQSDSSISISTLLFFAYVFLAVIVLIPLSVFLAEKTIKFIRSHWH